MLIIISLTVVLPDSHFVYTLRK